MKRRQPRCALTNSALSRLLLESGLRANYGDPEGLAILQRARDVFCVARTYRVYANRLVAEGHYQEALGVYRQALPIIRHWQNWREMDNLPAGIDAAGAGLGPLLSNVGAAGSHVHGIE